MAETVWQEITASRLFSTTTCSYNMISPRLTVINPSCELTRKSAMLISLVTNAKPHAVSRNTAASAAARGIAMCSCSMVFESPAAVSEIAAIIRSIYPLPKIFPIRYNVKENRTTPLSARVSTNAPKNTRERFGRTICPLFLGRKGRSSSFFK